MNKKQIRDVIGEAFRGVTLEDGTSILQTQVIDKYGEGYTDKQFDALAEKDIQHDWKILKLTDLDKCLVAHLDDKGFRYYIPALMCSVLESYPLASMRIIGTLQSLYPTRHHPDHSQYILARYEILNAAQRRAIAQFLKWLPELVDLDTEDRTVVDRAFRNYWKDFL